MPPKVQQSKAAKAAAAMSGGKSKKKKWSKGKVKDKAQHDVILDQIKYDRIFKEAATYKLVTVSVLVDRLKISGSVARVALKDLESQGIIKPVITHSKQLTYSMYFSYSWFAYVLTCSSYVWIRLNVIERLVVLYMY